MSSSSIDSAESEPVRKLAHRHGLDLSGEMHINELGLDFRIVSATDHSGLPWVLRIPRRPDVIGKIRHEARMLSLLRPRLPFAIPDWHIASDELVAYPKLTDPTAISVDAATHAVTWNIDQNSVAFTRALGKALAALHAVPTHDLASGGLGSWTSREAREQTALEIGQVKAAFNIAPGLERRWRAWLDDDTSWPNHSAVIHGDLYAGHILVNKQGDITGMIDWSEAEINDPAIDFSAHLLLFDEAGLAGLIRHYEAAGGRVWPRMAHHIAERLSFSPVKYALFALRSGEAVHLDAARAQLLQD